MHEISEDIVSAIKNGGKVFSCGNGGSSQQSNHFAAELVGKFNRERKALSAISLCNDIATITAVANDYGYENVFTRQLSALAKKGDVLITFSTSGKSLNVLNAESWGRMNGLKVHRLPIKSKHETTAQCQERHLKLLHLIAQEVEDDFVDFV